jgi:hypothetical protein
LAGVKTLIPGFGVMRRWPLGRRLRLVPGVVALRGEEKISACSCGASGSGLEIGESSKAYFDVDTFGVTVNLERLVAVL